MAIPYHFRIDTRIPYRLRKCAAHYLQNCCSATFCSQLYIFEHCQLTSSPFVKKFSPCQALTTLKSFTGKMRRCCSKQPSANPVPQVSTFKE